MSQQDFDQTIELLQNGDLEVEGYLPWSSNYTFLTHLENDESEAYAVYKPRQGERPLWDFAQGTLCQRERAAFVVSDGLGWNLVPPTVMREGPHGLGSLQLFVEHDPECHYFSIEGSKQYQRQLQKIVLLDIIINNADRKGGHILLEKSEDAPPTGRLWAIDHGVCFHSSYKLRTVVWEFAGLNIPDDLRRDVAMFMEKVESDSGMLRRSLFELLTRAEVSALCRRLERLVEQGTFWRPGPGRHYPWPPV